MDLIICLLSGKHRHKRKGPWKIGCELMSLWFDLLRSAEHYLRRRDLQAHSIAIFPNRLNSTIEFKDHQLIYMTNWSKFVSPQEFSLDIVRYSLWNFSQKLWCISSNTNWYHFIFYLISLKPKHMCNLSLQHIKKFQDSFL